MAEKSQIATTIEQSKRLLKAGIAQESADMEWVEIEVWNSGEKRMVNKWVLGASPCSLFDHPKYVPAWSLSRLIDINGPFQCDVDGSDDLMEHLVDALIFRLQHK